jgi:PhoH-like ATPase
MKKYILDTSTLISDPQSFKFYQNSEVIIPIAVLNELDKLKKQAGDVGRNARVSIRLIDEVSSLGDISTGILIDDNILIKVDANYYDIKSDSKFFGFGDPAYGDTQILASLYYQYLEFPDDDVTLVSNDINLRIKAKARGIDACGYEGNKFSVSDLYAGNQTLVDEGTGKFLLQNGFIDPEVFGLELNQNEFITFEDNKNEIVSYGRKTGKNKIELIKKTYPWGITPKNKEQAFSIDLVMDPNIDLVTLIGKAGTGKSLMVLACALQLVLSKKAYDKFVIYRPIQPVGNDIGFLPGTMEEKLAPWFHAIMDNFEFLLGTKNRDWKKDLEMWQKKSLIEMEAITYIRGRSIPNAIILVDECQNLTKDEVKTILTRAGENTKIILTGDIEQIDNSILDATNNGLTYIIEKFKNSELAGHITLTQGERSRLASKAAEIL